MRRLLCVPVIALAPLMVVACGAAKSLQASVDSAVAKLPGVSKVDATGEAADAVRVVKVRPQDLEDFPLGRERALAYEQQKKAGLLLPGGDVNFVPVDLPDPGVEVDGGLLPPKLP